MHNTNTTNQQKLTHCEQITDGTLALVAMQPGRALAAEMRPGLDKK